MTARPFTPRDAMLELGLRTQRIRESLTSHSAGHPLDVARAVRSLAAVRGADPSRRGPMDWIPGGGSTTFLGSGLPSSAPATASAPSPWTDFSGWLEAQISRNTSPYERVSPPDRTSFPREKDDEGRRPMDEQPPLVIKPEWYPQKSDASDGWDERGGDPVELEKLIHRGAPGDSPSTTTGNGGFQFPLPGGTPPTYPPTGAIVFNPNAPPPLPGQTAPKPDSPSKPGGQAIKTIGGVTVQIDAMPRALREELQKVAGAADRALRDFRHVCAMTGTGRRR